MSYFFRFFIFTTLFWYNIVAYSQTIDSIRNAIPIQDSATNLKEYTLNSQFGKALKFNQYLKQLDHLEYQSVGFMISQKTDGSKLWHQKFGYPTISLGVQYFDFKKHSEFGNALSLFATYKLEAKRWNKFYWDYWIGFGIGFNSNPYDYPRYPNPTLSTATNMFISFGTAVNYQVHPNYRLGLGLVANHLSNGAIKTPNKGLNFVAPQLSFTYHPNENIVKKNTEYSKDTESLKNTLEISGFYGNKMAHYKKNDRISLPDPYSGFNFNIFGLEALYTHQFSYKSSWGIGTGINYDQEYNSEMFVNNQELKKKKRFSNNQYLWSILPTYRLNLDRLKIDITLGYYPLKKEVEFNQYQFFQKLSLRYFISDLFFISFGINATELHQANYLEWKIGYTIFRKNK